jgi:exopolysaccharide biosynthesis polyprenyl glycosylphosphotransferase
MFRRFSITYAIYSMILDGVLAGFSLIIACATRPLYNGLPGVETVPFPIELPAPFYGLFPLMWVAVLLGFSVYDGRRSFKVVDEFAALSLGSLFAGVLMAGVLYVGYREMSRVIFLVFLAQTFALMLFWRVVARIVFRLRLPGLAPAARRVLILGAGEGGARLAQLVRAQAGLGLELVGFLDDDPACHPIAPLQSLRQVVKEQSIADVVVALPRAAHERLNWAVSVLHDLPVQVWVIPDYFSLALHQASVEEFAGIPMLDLRAPALSEVQRLVKRAFDLVVCFFSLPLSLPLIGGIALAVKLDSPGPAFYRARRMGENGRTFGMLKFRSMVCNADQLLAQVARRDEQGNFIHKIPGDPRVTRLGRFLRRTSLDELPQLINVLAGDMSLVGPRPEMPELVEQYAPWQRKRFAVPQGMTGWWQVNGRSDKPMHLHTEEDLYYVQHYSIWLDLQILLKTAWVVLRGKGAF